MPHNKNSIGLYNHKIATQSDTYNVISKDVVYREYIDYHSSIRYAATHECILHTLHANNASSIISW